jgi:ATP-dependent RNA helicase DHX8/PRP22
MNVKLGD